MRQGHSYATARTSNPVRKAAHVLGEDEAVAENHEYVYDGVRR
jgi:hypothetical protein